MKINIYTDGACSSNPGIGGWGVVILKNDRVIDLHGGQKNTTNNKMELTAAIEALKYLNEKENIEIFTDSKYVKNGIESWIVNWKKNGWKTKNKKPVKNKELWVELDKQIQKHNINWQWVQGHVGNKYNERADRLARQYIENNSFIRTN